MKAAIPKDLIMEEGLPKYQQLKSSLSAGSCAERQIVHQKKEATACSIWRIQCVDRLGFIAGVTGRMGLVPRSVNHCTLCCSRLNVLPQAIDTSDGLVSAEPG